MKYILSPPKYFKHDSVVFIHHNGNEMIGEIVCVQTSYSKKAGAKNPHGYHTYGINTPTAMHRTAWIGEKSIIELNNR